MRCEQLEGPVKGHGHPHLVYGPFPSACPSPDDSRNYQQATGSPTSNTVRQKDRRDRKRIRLRPRQAWSLLQAAGSAPSFSSTSQGVGRRATHATAAVACPGRQSSIWTKPTHPGPGEPEGGKYYFSPGGSGLLQHRLCTTL